MKHGSFDRRLSKLAAMHQSKISQVEREALEEIIAYLNELAARKIIGDPFVQAEIEAVNTFLRAL